MKKIRSIGRYMRAIFRLYLQETPRMFTLLCDEVGELKGTTFNNPLMICQQRLSLEYV